MSESQIDAVKRAEEAETGGKTLDDLLGSDDSDSDFDEGARDADDGSDSGSENESEKEKIPKKRKLESSEKSHKSKKLAKETANKVKKLFDTEAEQSGSDSENEGGSKESDSDESASEEVDENADYEYDGFVVRDGEDSDSDTDLFDRSDKKKRNKPELKRIQKKKINRLDEEDYQLIRDNLEGFSGDRSQGRTSADVDGAGSSDDEAAAAADDDQGDDSAVNTAVANKLPLKLPGSGAGYDDYDDGSDMEGFLADESDEDGEGKEPREHAAPKPVRRSRGVRGPTADQTKDALDIFGAGFDDFDDDKESDEDDEDMDEDDVAHLTEEDRQKVLQEKLRAKYDRSVLVENFCTESDDVIRQEDVPERLQDKVNSRGTMHEKDIEEEANWMGKKLFEWMVVLNESISSSQESLVPKLQESCKHVLRFYLVNYLEVPFIWTCRKDYLDASITCKHLWKMIELDEIWVRLLNIRRRLWIEIQAINDAASFTKDSNDSWVRLCLFVD